MEQRIDREIVTNSIKKISFWNKPSTRIFILIGIILVAIWYFTEWVPKQKCGIEVKYQPATESRPSYKMGSVELPAMPGTSEYYSYNGEKFKTREEAVNYCAKNI